MHCASDAIHKGAHMQYLKGALNISHCTSDAVHEGAYIQYLEDAGGGHVPHAQGAVHAGGQ
jgi:hypothetical protein